MTDSPYIDAQPSSRTVQNCAADAVIHQMNRTRLTVIKPAVVKRGKVIKKAITKPAT